MGRLSEQERARNEAAIRAAMDRLLRGEIPTGGRCDLKTLAAEAGITRTGFYAKGNRPGPYQHLAEEFERRRKALQNASNIPDPRDAQIARLKQQITELKKRISSTEGELAELKMFKTLAISRLAAQHEEIERLRQRKDRPANIRNLRTGGGDAPIGPC